MRILLPLALTACFTGTAPPPATSPPQPPPRVPPLESYALRWPDGVVRLDLANEAMQPLFPMAHHEMFVARSLGAIDDQLYLCLREDRPEGQVVAIEIATGQIDRSSYMSCGAVTTRGDQIWILSGPGPVQRLTEYRNLATLRSHSAPNRESKVPHGDAALIAANDSHLFVASDTGTDVNRIDRSSGEVSQLTLAIDGPRIQGIAATETQLYVAGDRGIRVFELPTGRRLRTLFPDESFFGLTAPAPKPFR
jgi:hypothetical protein